MLRPGSRATAITIGSPRRGAERARPGHAKGAALLLTAKDAVRWPEAAADGIAVLEVDWDWRERRRRVERLILGDGDGVSDADVLVLGSGIAGLSLALRAAEHADVLVISKLGAGHQHQSRAGRNRRGLRPADSFAAHERDTLKCGAGLCDPRVVREVVREGPERVLELVELGVRFTKEQRPAARPRGRALAPAHRARPRPHRAGDRAWPARAGARVAADSICSRTSSPST